MRSTSVDPGTSGCAGQLLTINANSRFWARGFRSKYCIQSLKIYVSIQLFSCALYWHGKDLTFLKHLGFFLFPMTNNRSFSPVALTVQIPVSLTVLHFPLSFPKFCLVVLEKKTKLPGVKCLPIYTLTIWLVDEFPSRAQSFLVGIIFPHLMLF